MGLAVPGVGGRHWELFDRRGCEVVGLAVPGVVGRH